MTMVICPRITIKQHVNNQAVLRDKDENWLEFEDRILFMVFSKDKTLKQLSSKCAHALVMFAGASCTLDVAIIVLAYMQVLTYMPVTINAANLQLCVLKQNSKNRLCTQKI